MCGAGPARQQAAPWGLQASAPCPLAARPLHHTPPPRWEGLPAAAAPALRTSPNGAAWHRPGQSAWPHPPRAAAARRAGRGAVGSPRATAPCPPQGPVCAPARQRIQRPAPPPRGTGGHLGRCAGVPPSAAGTTVRSSRVVRAGPYCAQSALTSPAGGLLSLRGGHSASASRPPRAQPGPPCCAPGGAARSGCAAAGGSGLPSPARCSRAGPPPPSPAPRAPRAPRPGAVTRPVPRARAPRARRAPAGASCTPISHPAAPHTSE
mmetsp:Transcript_4001/g.11149  ORF Transcript_4001/g.11149 Transcript_4001/m.11149 type:complete len:264 (-) Transcript_4001:2080-2871(-)